LIDWYLTPTLAVF